MNKKLLAGFAIVVLLLGVASSALTNQALAQTSGEITKAKVKDTMKDKAKAKFKDTMKEKIKDVAKEKIKDIAKEKIKDVAKEKIKDIAKEKIKDVAKEKIKDIAKEKIKDVAKEKMIEETKGIAKKKISDQMRDEIKQRAKHLAMEKVRTLAKDLAEQKIRKKILEQERMRVLEDEKENTRKRIKAAGMDEDFDIKKRISAKEREKIIEQLKKSVDDDQEKSRDLLINEIKEILSHRGKLVIAKLASVGEKNFDDIKEKYKKTVIENAKKHLDNIRGKIKSELLAQVENGTYYGEAPDESSESITYKLEFKGVATQFSDTTTVRDVSGDVSLELISTSDRIVKFKVIGGEVILTEPESDKVTQVFDVSFGRSRILSVESGEDNKTTNKIHVILNTEGLDGTHQAITLHAEVDGSLPTKLGDEPTVVHAGTTSKSNISGLWLIDVGGSLALDELIPEDAPELADVADVVQTQEITEEIAKNSTSAVSSDVTAEVQAEINEEIKEEIKEEVDEQVKEARQETESDDQEGN